VKDSRFGSWPTAQARTNNLKDKGTGDKRTISPCIKNNKKKCREVIYIHILGSPLEIKSKLQ
jgi:hypothetical protein